MLPFRMLPVCTRLGLVCYPYVCVRIRMSSVCTRMYSYVTRMYSYSVLVTINFKLFLIFSHQLHYLTQGFLVCINNKQNVSIMNNYLLSEAFLQCIGSLEKAQADSGASAKSGVQNQISVLSRAARPRQTTDVVR